MTAGDRPRLCLLPGLDGTGRLYAPLLTALADVADVDVLAYDSEQFKDYPELAEALAPRLPGRGHVVLVAESFAGPLAVLLAHRHPARVRGLVLAASFVHAPLPASRIGATLLERLPAIAPPLPILERWLAGGELPPALRVAFLTAMRTVRHDVLRRRALAALRVDVRGELAALQIPVLHLQAGRDRLIGRHAGRQILRCARDARQATIDAPHFLFQMAPEAAAVGIRHFLNGIGQRTAG